MLTPDYENISLEKDFVDGEKTGKCLSRLYFGKRKIMMSPDEFQKLESLYKKYLDKNAVELGFVNYILRGVN